jgi:hypothetical protein
LPALRRGAAAAARRRADAALEGLLALPPMSYPQLEAASSVAEVYAALWSEVAGDARAHALAALVARSLSILRGFGFTTPIARSRALLWHGRWAAMRGRATRALLYLKQALASAVHYRMPFDEALARQALADAEDLRGGHARAAEHRRRARELFEQLGASWYAARVSALAAPA